MRKRIGTLLIGTLLPCTLLAAPKPLPQFTAKIYAWMKQYHVPGAQIAIMRRDHLLYATSLGWANVDEAVRVNNQMLFRIASISKTITAIATLKMIQQHRLDFNDRVFRILNNITPLPTLKRRLATNKITVRMLLNMTSGWNGWGKGAFDPMFGNWPHRYSRLVGHSAPMAAKTDARLALSLPLYNKPGTQFHYANINYCLLGLLIDKREHQPLDYHGYERYVQHNVLHPLGIYDMKIGSANYDQRDPHEVLYYPSNYYRHTDHLYLADLPYTNDGILHKNFSDGGWLTTATDLVKIANALQYGHLLQKQYVHAMIALPTANRSIPSWYYGMGWFVRVNGEISTHGSFSGTNSLLVIRRDGTTFAMIFNRKPAPMQRLWQFRHKLIALINKTVI